MTVVLFLFYVLQKHISSKVNVFYGCVMMSVHQGCLHFMNNARLSNNIFKLLKTFKLYKNKTDNFNIVLLYQLFMLYSHFFEFLKIRALQSTLS